MSTRLKPAITITSNDRPFSLELHIMKFKNTVFSEDKFSISLWPYFFKKKFCTTEVFLCGH